MHILRLPPRIHFRKSEKKWSTVPQKRTLMYKMSQIAIENMARMCSQNKMADASFAPCPRKLATAPASIDVGIECCRRRTNRKSLLFAGRNPRWFAVCTMVKPIGGTRNKRVKTIATVVRNPSSEFPGPPIKLPPRTSIIHGTMAPPSILRLSVKKKNTECSSKNSSLRVGVAPIIKAKRDDTTGG